MNKQNRLYKFLEERKARILALKVSGMPAKKIADKEGMSLGRVYQILREKGWQSGRERAVTGVEPVTGKDWTIENEKVTEA